jgi:hypothetical protein
MAVAAGSCDGQGMEEPKEDVGISPPRRNFTCIFRADAEPSGQSFSGVAGSDSLPNPKRTSGLP